MEKEDATVSFTREFGKFFFFELPPTVKNKTPSKPRTHAAKHIYLVSCIRGWQKTPTEATKVSRDKVGNVTGPNKNKTVIDKKTLTERQNKINEII